MKEIDTMHPAVAAADYVVAALGRDGAHIALWALRADWLLAREAIAIEPLAAAIAYLIGEEVPKHRGKPCKTVVGKADVGAAISRALEGR